MIGEIKQVQSKPAKHNKDGEMVHNRYASININVPMDTAEQIKEITELIAGHSDGEYIIKITPVKEDLFPVTGDADDDEEEDAIELALGLREHGTITPV